MTEGSSRASKVVSERTWRGIRCDEGKDEGCSGNEVKRRIARLQRQSPQELVAYVGSLRSTVRAQEALLKKMDEANDKLRDELATLRRDKLESEKRLRMYIADFDGVLLRVVENRSEDEVEDVSSVNLLVPHEQELQRTQESISSVPATPMRSMSQETAKTNTAERCVHATALPTQESVADSVESPVVFAGKNERQRSPTPPSSPPKVPTKDSLQRRQERRKRKREASLQDRVARDAEFNHVEKIQKENGKSKNRSPQFRIQKEKSGAEILAEAKRSCNMNTSSGTGAFKFQDVERRKRHRLMLPAHPCPDCAKAHLNKDFGGFLKQCARHRAMHQNPPTPEKFWDIPSLETISQDSIVSNDSA